LPGAFGFSGVGYASEERSLRDGGVLFFMPGKQKRHISFRAGVPIDLIEI